MLPRKQFYESASDLTEFRRDLKQITCPHCRQRGTLICHGFLRGYTYHSKKRQIRGRRFFCSNRQRRQGCGRTFSLLAAEHLRGFTVTAITLWRFICSLAAGDSVYTAFRAATSAVNIRAAWHFLRRVNHAQVRLRSILHRYFPVPDPPAKTHPIQQTIAHLNAAFPNCSCPISAFQSSLQRSFL